MSQGVWKIYVEAPDGRSRQHLITEDMVTLFATDHAEFTKAVLMTYLAYSADDYDERQKRSANEARLHTEPDAERSHDKENGR